jgi:hypothetical protein
MPAHKRRTNVPEPTHYLTLSGTKVDIPSWVTYIAQDADGEWYGYRMKPVIDNDMWLAIGKAAASLALIQIALICGPAPADFTEELYQIDFEA